MARYTSIRFVSFAHYDYDDIMFCSALRTCALSHATHALRLKWDIHISEKACPLQYVCTLIITSWITTSLDPYIIVIDTYRFRRSIGISSSREYRFLMNRYIRMKNVSYCRRDCIAVLHIKFVECRSTDPKQS